MNSDNCKNVKKDDDLVFVPLNIKEPFSQSNSSWIPAINFDKSNVTNLTNNFFVGLPPVMGNNCDLKLPEPTLVPKPLTPYPKVSDELSSELNTYDKPFQPPMNKIGESDLQYPSEISEDELYSYNEIEQIKRFDDEIESNPIHLEILRNFDFSMEDINLSDKRGSKESAVDTIFDSIQKNNNGVLSALRAYGIPYPIACLIIKRIIKLTLQSMPDSHCKCDKDCSCKKHKRR